jgi:DNA-binding beta-propeller fold protein YncE
MFPLLLALAAAPAASSIQLPGGPPVSMDYLAYDAGNDRVWVPAGNTGQVDVIDARTGRVTAVGGFQTAKVMGRDGKEREVGPSSATVGDGRVYVGNRAGSQVCALDAKTLERRGCVTLPTPPDGLAWVATTKEVWVTAPRDGSILVLDATSGGAPSLVGRIPVAHPEGYAVDADRGLFYTNMEEEDRTVVIDARRRAVVGSWGAGCGAGGPRGLALDARRRHLFVACPHSVRVLDAAKGGALLGELEVGEGPDNIDYSERLHTIYAAAGRGGRLTAAEIDAQGKPTRTWSAPSPEGGRVVVVDAGGAAYVADSKGGRIVVFK